MVRRGAGAFAEGLAPVRRHRAVPCRAVPGAHPACCRHARSLCLPPSAFLRRGERPGAGPPGVGAAAGARGAPSLKPPSSRASRSEPISQYSSTRDTCGEGRAAAGAVRPQWRGGPLWRPQEFEMRLAHPVHSPHRDSGIDRGRSSIFELIVCMERSRRQGHQGSPAAPWALNLVGKRAARVVRARRRRLRGRRRPRRAVGLLIRPA